MQGCRNRRMFIKSSAAGIAGLGVLSSQVLDAGLTHAAVKAKVAVIENDKAINGQNVCDRAQSRIMVDRALAAITGKQRSTEAWASLGVTRDDIVGIKVNCNTWTFRLFTHPGLVYALCDSLSEVVPPNNVIIYERSSAELAQCGFTVNKGASGIRCFGNNEGGGFHAKEELTKIITDTCTKIINMPSLKAVDSEFAGSLFIKNHIGSLPGNHMSRCHGNAEFCSQVCARPSIKNKTVLAVCDGLRGTYARGKPWYYGGIIMSADQVAAECIALDTINTKRTEEGMNTLAIPSYVINAGAKYGLGTAEKGSIDRVKIVL